MTIDAGTAQKGEREEALEPCPFCNAAPIPVDDPQGPLGIMAHPSEGDCFLAGREISGRQGRARWNRRASSKTEGEMREAADAVCGELEKWLPTLSNHRSRQDCNRIRYVIANYRALSSSKAEGEMREAITPQAAIEEVENAFLASANKDFPLLRDIRKRLRALSPKESGK